jgi:hypothetical protein
MARDMTDDERRQFAKDTLHQGPETRPGAGPSSESEIVRDVEPPADADKAEILPPNPD